MPDSIQSLLQTTAIDKVIAAAITTGALQAITTQHEFICAAGMRFMVRWISSLAHKDAARVIAAGKCDPDFNPFLPPEPELLVGALGDTHLVVLNKYPVIARHLLIITRAFTEQSAPLTAADFDALAHVMDTLGGGLGFYNGGTEAGASQRHKHLQWIPEVAHSASLEHFSASLPADIPVMGLAQHPHMPWRHVFVRHATANPAMPATLTGKQLHEAFERACAHLGVDANADPMPPYNMLADKEWMLLVPRSRERYEGISVNALGFAGSLFVRKPEQIAIIRTISPLQLLAEVACRQPNN